MGTNNELSGISEVYWLLDRVLEDLGMVKQLLYDKYEPYERLFLSSLLAFSGLTNDDTEIDNLVKELKNSRWKAWSWTISFYLGVLARNYIRKKHRLLPNVDEITDVFKDIGEKLSEFHGEGDLRKIVDALFLEALILDLTANVLNLDVSKICTNIKFVNKLVDEYVTKSLELPFEYRIKIAYSTLVLHDIFNKVINHDDLRKLLHGLLDYLNSINIEYRTFMLRVLTALQMIKERQKVLKSLIDEYKSRFMYTTEKVLLRKLIVKLISGDQSRDLSIKYREGEETIMLEIKLTEEQIENVARPNINQLCLLALGLIVSGYHSSYTLPLHEQRNYIHFTDLVKEMGEDKVQDRLLLLDKLKLDEVFISFLNEKLWPIFRSKLIFELILLGSVAVALDYFLYHFLLPMAGIAGKVAHITVSGIVIVAFLYILRTVANAIHAKLRETFNYLTGRKLRQALVESFKDELYKKLDISR